ncbi:MAG TPA: hypothetical protein VMV86_00945 [Methanosarcinales archaeon]|nr:hypothetical protein [Methanosarcinales archaeon]
MKLSMEEVKRLKAAVTHGTCWTEDIECRNCTSLPMCNAVRNLIDTIEAQQQEIDRLYRWVSDLQRGIYVNCVYCGHRYGPESDTPVSMADVLKEHIEQCKEHPMSKLKHEIDANDSALERERRGVASIIEQYTTDFTEEELAGDVLCPREKVVLEYAHETLELLEAVGGREK